MIRRSLFFGLTLILVVALVSLVFRGHRQQKLEASQAAEVVKEAASSPTRVFAPSDLEVIRSTAEFGKKSEGSLSSFDARHEIEILNKGKMPYRKFQLAFQYTDRKGKPLATKTHLLSKILLPGNTLKVSDILVDTLPLPAADFKTAILYADLGEKP